MVIWEISQQVEDALSYFESWEQEKLAYYL